jgi:HAD superfamily hydrolase (TIGR01450 family)
VAPTATTIAQLLDGYHGVLLDAFGVLVDSSGMLPSAPRLLEELGRRGTPFAIVTNDASRTLETHARRFGGLVAPERIVTAGSLLPDYFRRHGLAGARTCVLGTAASEAFVREGGGVLVALEAGMAFDVLAVCDDDGTPFLEGIELATSAVLRALDEGRRPRLVLPNPDVIFPKAPGEIGFTAGAMALLVEAALARRGADLRFEVLGKPQPALFEAAARRLGIAPGRLVMIGDQLETDIAGAAAAGIPTALLLTGVSRWPPVTTAHEAVAPTHLLATIEP